MLFLLGTLLATVQLMTSCKRERIAASEKTGAGAATGPAETVEGRKEEIKSPGLTAEQLSTGPRLSSNGKVFTPRGQIKFLLIFAGFDSEEGRAPMGWWPAGANALIKHFSTDHPASVFFTNNNQFPATTSPANKSLSSYFYEMSGGKFKVTAEALTDPDTGKPVRIDISPDGLSNWGQANRRVMEKIKERYEGKINWAKFDQRTNSPNYAFDSSLSAPDGEPDYVIIVYRNQDRIGSLPTNFYASSRLNGIGDLKIRGTDGKMYGFGKEAGFTYAKGALFDTNLFLHELAHELFDCPHYFATGSVVWNRFFLSNGISMMNLGEISTSCNAWEAWYLGWLDLKQGHDITAATVPEKPVVVRDFLTYKEPIRIAIPNTSPVQHLWIENRQQVHVLDGRSSFRQDNMGNSIPDPPTGLYFYVEDLAPTRVNPQPLVYNRNNSMRLLHAAGNYDYTVTNFDAEKRIWCNITGTIAPAQVPNPLSGSNDISAIPGDYATYRKEPECSAVLVAQPNGRIAYNGTNMNFGSFEHATVVKKGNVFTYGWWAAFDPKVPGSTSVAFQEVGQGAGLSYSTPILPLQVYHATPPNPVLSPVLLNGLSVKIVGKRPDTGGRKAGEEYLLEVRYNDTDIQKDQRFTGTIVQQKVPGATNGYDVNLKSGVTLFIDKSGTSNRHLPTEAKDFITPTTYTIEAGSIFHQEKKSAVVVMTGSTFKVKDGAKVWLEEGASFQVQTGGSMVLEPNAQFLMGTGTSLTINQATVTLEKNGNGLSLGAGSKIRVQRKGRLVLAGSPKAERGGTVEIVVESGGVLELRNSQVVNYHINVQPGGRLVVPAAANVNLSTAGKINIAKGGGLCLHPSAKVVGANKNNLSYGSGALSRAGCL